MELATLIQIFVAIFAVFGIYAFLREICRVISGKHRNFIAVELKNDDDCTELYDMIYEAMTIAENDVRFKKTPILLLSNDFSIDDSSRALLKTWNIRIFREDVKH